MIKATYERDVQFCKPTNYVKIVTIDSVSPAINSDNLEVVTFKGIGYCSVAPKGKHKPGDVVMFIPADTVLPLEYSELIGVTKYLSKGRVKVANLRGNRSEGIITDVAEDWLPHFLKWEDPPTTIMTMGYTLGYSETPANFPGFYKMPNLLNEPETFSPGEEIFYSEKIHGTNCRFGRHVMPDKIVDNPLTNLFYLGSHEKVFDLDRTGQEQVSRNLYFKAVMTTVANIDILPVGVTFFAEVFGRKIQHLHYEMQTPAIRVFAGFENGHYMLPHNLVALCDSLGIHHVQFHRAKFTNVEDFRAIADQPSEYTKAHGREGIVIVSASRPGVMAKLISFKYLVDQGRTERH